MTLFFAWVDEGTAFNAGTHSVEDEVIYSIDITQNEGDYAVLTMEIENPGVGLLSAGRKQWAWLSEDGEALFYGRVDAAADDVQSEIITIELVAEPIDIVEQKAALAADLREAPYWDDAFIQQEADNPDTVMESRTAHWDVDRITHELRVVDILNPGDPDIEITEDQHFYDAFNLSKNGTPLKKIFVKLVAKWRQKATGTVDLTEKLWKAFQTTGSPFNFPSVGSFTSVGLANEWPEPLKNLNGGWTMGVDSFALVTEFVQSGFYPVTYIDKSATEITGDADAVAIDDEGNSFLDVQQPGFMQSQYGNPILGVETLFNTAWKEWQVSFPILPVNQKFTVDFNADRERQEILTFTATADVQSLFFDPGSDEEEEIELTSEFIDQPVDPGEVMPIVDLRRNMYFPTDRGQISVQYALLLCYARFIWRSRAIHIELECEWDLVRDIISNRRRVLLHDYRIPGGTALGKVISYSLVATAERKIARITLGCSVGKDIALPAADPGLDTYIDDYIDDYYEMEDMQIDVIPGVIQYDALDETIVIDDDGVDFFNMVPDTVLYEPITIANGLNDQKELIDGAVDEGITDPDPIGVLRDNPTKPRLRLIPVTGGAFLSEYEVTVSPLTIPKMIDLEAA